MNRVNVLVKCNARENKVVLVDGVYHIFTKTSAREGKANESMLSLLSEYMDIPKSCLSIKLGMRSKKKVIEINS